MQLREKGPFGTLCLSYVACCKHVWSTMYCRCIRWCQYAITRTIFLESKLDIVLIKNWSCFILPCMVPLLIADHNSLDLHALILQPQLKYTWLTFSSAAELTSIYTPSSIAEAQCCHCLTGRFITPEHQLRSFQSGIECQSNAVIYRGYTTINCIPIIILYYDTCTLNN